MIHFHDVIGFTGITMIVGAYFLLQSEWIRSDDLKYSVLNAVGALCVLYSIHFEFNLSAFLIEVFWVIISGIGIFRYFTGQRVGDRNEEVNT